MLPFADGAIFFARAIGLELAALHAHRRFGHVSLPADCTRHYHPQQDAAKTQEAVRQLRFREDFLARASTGRVLVLRKSSL